MDADDGCTLCVSTFEESDVFAQAGVLRGDSGQSDRVGVSAEECETHLLLLFQHSRALLFDA